MLNCLSLIVGGLGRQDIKRVRRRVLELEAGLLHDRRPQSVFVGTRQQLRPSPSSPRL